MAHDMELGFNEVDSELALSIDEMNEQFDRAFKVESDDDYDFEDVDCEDCGLKFFIRPSAYFVGDTRVRNDRPYPTKCYRCLKGLPPLYEY